MSLLDMKLDSLMRWITSLGAVIGLLIFAYSFVYSRVYTLRFAESASQLEKRLKEFTEEQKAMQFQIDGLAHSLSQIPDSLKYRDLGTARAELLRRIDQLSESNLAIRQALNPLNPDEVLTIARLKDALESMKKSQDEFAEKIDERLENLRSSVLRELDASSKSANWLFVIVVPLVINLLYTMWKDARSVRNRNSGNISD
jgi:hypothetical protein